MLGLQSINGLNKVQLLHHIHLAAFFSGEPG